MTVSESEHVGLVQRACSDPDAFAQLYLMHYNTIFHYCARRLFDRHSAEDVTSTVFFKVMHSLDSFDGTAIDFRSWLLRIATNAVNDHLRDARRRTEAMKKVVSLKPKYQTVITLRFFENMKLTEIAACLGKKPSTVRSWLLRATAKLRKTLNTATDSRGSR
ncbi:MAG: RNA polymerase sigma factor [Planctomycetota bacterium]